MKDSAKRLYEAAQQIKGVTGQSAVAKMLGESPQTVKNWESRGVSKKGIISACRIIGCSAIWLEKGEGGMTGVGFPVVAADDSNPPNDAVQIKRVKFEVSAGISGNIIEQTEETGNPIYFRQDWLSRKGYYKDRLVAVYVKGESMEPGLYDGDTIIVNLADTEPHDGTVYVFRYEGETVVKRLVRDAGKWWLSSDNADKNKFPRKECLDEICEIVGKVVYKQSERV